MCSLSHVKKKRTTKSVKILILFFRLVGIDGIQTTGIFMEIPSTIPMMSFLGLKVYILSLG
jgi:hypothetical protein